MPEDLSNQKNDLVELINTRIENLRPKLLDLTRRNPLLSTKFSDKSHSHIRIVDEFPQIIFERLLEDTLKFVPLPALIEDPKDEDNRDFQDALSDARITDETYLADLEAIDHDAEDAPEKLTIAERALKDRIREKLGMPARQTTKSLSLIQHAHNNNIEPSYDLVSPDESSPDDEPFDDQIQTLLLPDMMERRLNSIISKCDSWIDETGINVLRAAFGFLEWTESGDSRLCLAPLVLIAVEITKAKTRGGFEFSVTSLGEAPETNTVLIEKLKRDFGLELPVFSPEEKSLEGYFAEIINLIPKGVPWRVRRQVAIGVFPSARMAMYHDLNTENWNFPDHEVISNLLGGKNQTGIESPFGDDYEIDKPEIEIKVPMIVTDADASQFSVIVDVMDNKNVAVEGPPGTGKSQTIVNTIASALANGKKVLFIAEKTAALEVVSSRLEAFELGEFILPLQATKSTKEKVIESIRSRITLPNERDPIGLDEKIRQFKSVRDQLSEYIDTISTRYESTDFTVHDILGWGIKAHNKLSKYLSKLGAVHVLNVKTLSQENINEILHFCNLLESSWQKAKLLKEHWKHIGKGNIDPYSAEEILHAAKECAQCCLETHIKREALVQFNVDTGIDSKKLSFLKSEMEELDKLNEKIDIELLRRMLEGSSFMELTQFFGKLEELEKLRVKLAQVVIDPLNTETPAILERLVQTMEFMSLSEPTIESMEQVIIRLKQKLISYKLDIEKLESVLKVVEFMKERPASVIVSICDAKRNISKMVLSLRSSKLEAPDAREFIARASQRAKSLLGQKMELDKKFLFVGKHKKEELDLNSVILANSGLFYFLSPKFYKAKKFYTSICKDKAFEKNKAALSLKEIIQWQDDYKIFNDEAALKELFGGHFNGCETNFPMFIELIDFYDRMDQSLNGIENIPCREFLRKGDIDLILALPEFMLEDPLRKEQRNYSQLLENIAAGENKVEIYQGRIGDIQKGISHLKITQGLPPNKIKETVKDILYFQSTWKIVSEDDHVRQILGSYFKGAETTKNDVKESLLAVIKIVALEIPTQKIVYNIIEKKQSREAIQIFLDVLASDATTEKSLNRLNKVAKIEREKIIGSLSWKGLSEFLAEASNDKEGLLAHSSVFSNRSEVLSRGCGAAVDALIDSEYGLHELSEIIWAVISKSLVKEVYADHGSILSKYNGNKLNHLRARLAELDREIIELSRKKLRVQLRKQANPPPGVGQGRKGHLTQMALLNHEITKKQRFIPVRELTMRAGQALLELKPCWMMSPLAVAQYINKGDIEFDLVIIDEASQMTPEDSIGALARGKHAMVVGDTNQLPPTSFFRKMLDDPDEDDDEVVSEESILEMANAVFRPARRLRWHYRSKHPNLIAFSNKYVYDEDLTIFPCPDTHTSDKGVKFHPVKGLYSNGTNPIEATEMVNAAIRFMHTNKDMSLGIVVLNQKQQELVSEQMEYALAHDQIAQEYVEKWASEKTRKGLEKFFVKNLENVQGDERDVIFIGTVYGPEKEGAPVMQRFGPINGIAGKRRLNVLFSRSKYQIVTFSSMTSNDIRVDGSSNEGVILFKAWLEYSVSGQLLEWAFTDKKPDSVFEEYVITQLKAIGCEVIPQVGVAGFFIDIGVRHPEYPHGFIMGIECDGRTYHSSKSARDRDRLRQEVLIGLGWNLYRIWSTDWFNDPIYEAARLRVKIESRLQELRNRGK